MYKDDQLPDPYMQKLSTLCSENLKTVQFVLYSSWVEISMDAKFQPPMLPRSGRFMVGGIEFMASLASSSS